MVGSFLNVVIHRLPKMLEHDWRTQCRELLHEDQVSKDDQKEVLGLSLPRSQCPACGHLITALENIPVVSYVFLMGRCRHCRAKISLRYPFVEILTAALSAFVVWHFGFSWQACAGVILTCALICLTFIDFDTQYLPDSITLPFLWGGLGLSLFSIFADSHSSIIGAIAGYLSLWSVYQIFLRLTGKEGMGYGDFKLLGLFGAWFGYQYLPAIVIISSMVGTIVGVSLILLKINQRNTLIPFGPYLASAGWLVMIWGDQFNHAYLRWAGFA